MVLFLHELTSDALFAQALRKGFDALFGQVSHEPLGDLGQFFFGDHATVEGEAETVGNGVYLAAATAYAADTA